MTKRIPERALSPAEVIGGAAANMPRDIFSRRVRAIVLTIVVVAVVAFSLRVFMGKSLASNKGNFPDSYTSGALGHLAFYQTLEKLGYKVTRNRSDNIADISTPMLFIEPARKINYEGQEDLSLNEVVWERNDNGYLSVIVLPKWFPDEGVVRSQIGEADRILQDYYGEAPDDDGQGDFAGDYETIPHEEDTEDSNADFEAGPDLNKLKQLLDQVKDSQATETGRVLRIGSRDAFEIREVFGSLGQFDVVVPALQLMPVDAAEALLSVASDGSSAEQSVNALITRWENIIIVSDADLVHSYNLQRADNTSAMVALLDSFGSSQIVFDETFHGHGRKLSIANALGTFPGVLLFIHVLLFLTILLWSGLFRLGPPRQEHDALAGQGARPALDIAARVLADGQSDGVLAQDYVRFALREIDDLTLSGVGRQSGPKHRQPRSTNV